MSGIIAQNTGRQTGLVKAVSAAGEWTLIQTLTSDGSDADLSFTSGIDSTYDEYCFKFNNIHPETNSKILGFQSSTDTGSSYGVTATTTFFRAQNVEDASDADVATDSNMDFAQSTSFIYIGRPVLNDADASLSGTMYMFAPSSTTFVKHFMYRIHVMGSYSQDAFGAGYFNTTSAVDAVQFKFADGEIQDGSISLYGIG